MLRHRIISGEVPLWNASGFSDLFKRAGEAAGVMRKRPSRAAQDLTRRLLNPRRRLRPTAVQALQSEWFTRPSDEVDDRPLLDRDDFESGFGSVEKERVSNENPRTGRPCCVCRNVAGPHCHVCAQCDHLVCIACMGNVEGVCPHCKHESSDMIFSRALSWLVKPTVRARENAKRPRSTSPPQPKRFLESSDCDICGPLSPRGNSARHRSTYDPDCSRSPRQRVPVVRQVSPRFAPVKGERCHYCKVERSVLDHVCPACNTSVCVSCVGQYHWRDKYCPCCRELNEGSLNGMLSTVQTRNAAKSFLDGIAGIKAALSEVCAVPECTPPPCAPTR